MLQSIAVKQGGTRAPEVERNSEEFLKAPPCEPALDPEARLRLYHNVSEPALQRELKHRGAANGDGSDSADLVACVEIVNFTTTP